MKIFSKNRMDTQKIIAGARKVLDGKAKKGQISPLWDGKAAERIVQIIDESLNNA